MAKLEIVKGTTSKLLQVFIQDSSSSTGAGLTGLVFNSAGLSAYYYREGAASATAITLATMTLGTWATGGFIVVDGTNMPGVYQLGIPDAALASGANSVTVMLKGATNMAPLLLEIELTGTNNQDAVRFGMTALPNAAAEAAGGLCTRGTGAGQINQAANGQIDVNAERLNNVAQSLLDLKDFADDGYDPVTNKVQGVVLTDTVTTYTGNTPQTGDAFARLGAPAGASVSADIAAIEAQTDDIGVAGAGLTAVPWNPAWDAEVQSEVEDGLIVHRLDELLNADSDIDGVAPPVVGSVFHELMSKTAGSFTFDQTTDSLEAVRDNQGTPQTGDSFARLGAPVGASISADIAGVQSDTDNIQTRLPAALVSGKMDSDMTSISGDVIAADNAEAFFDGTGYAGTGNVIPSVTTVTGNVNGSVASVGAGGITAASIATGAVDADALAADAATEIATAIMATTLAELGVAAPAATPTLAQAIMLNYMALRNKRTVTGTKDTLFNDAGVAIAHADLTDDGTTFTASELASGA